MPTCLNCGKECANDFGLKAHMRSHAAKDEAPAATPKATAEAAPVEVKRAGGFVLMSVGDTAYVTKGDGLKLTRPLPPAEAAKIFDRWSTSKR